MSVEVPIYKRKKRNKSIVTFFYLTGLTVPFSLPVVVSVDSSALKQSADPDVIKQSTAVVLRQHGNFSC